MLQRSSMDGNIKLTPQPPLSHPSSLKSYNLLIAISAESFGLSQPILVLVIQQKLILLSRKYSHGKNLVNIFDTFDLSKELLGYLNLTFIACTLQKLMRGSVCGISAIHIQVQGAYKKMKTVLNVWAVFPSAPSGCCVFPYIMIVFACFLVFCPSHLI